MKRKRQHTVKVAYPPAGSFVQELYCIGNIPGFNGVLIGPFVFDLSGNQIIDTPDEYGLVFFSEVRQCFQENEMFEDRNFYHSYFTGKLSAYTSNTNKPESAEYPWNEYEGIFGTAHIKRERLVDARYLESENPQMFVCALGSFTGDFAPATYFTSLEERVLQIGSNALLRLTQSSSSGKAYMRSWAPNGELSGTDLAEFVSLEATLNPETGQFNGSFRAVYKLKHLFPGQTDSDVEWEEYSQPILVIPSGPAKVMPPDPDGSSRRLFIDMVRDHLIDLFDQVEKRIPPTYGKDDLAIECLNALRIVNVNGLAFLKELTEMKGFIEPVIKLIKSKLLDPKAWTGFLLWWKYGAKLTYQDWRTILSALKNVRKVAKSIKQYYKYRTSLQTRYATQFSRGTDHLLGDWRQEQRGRLTSRLSVPDSAIAIDGLVQLMQDMDIRLTAENFWDLIPFSFVIDWFLSVGDLLEKIDYSQEIRHQQIKNFVTSRKISGELPQEYTLDAFGLVGQLRYTVYLREVSYDFPPPQWTLESKITKLTNHWYEGGLLIIQAAQNGKFG